MANGIVSLAMANTWSAPCSVYFEYFSLPTSMANQKSRLSEQNRHFVKVSKTNTKLAKSIKKRLCSDFFYLIEMCLLLAAGQSTALSFCFPSSEEHAVNAKFEFAKYPKGNSKRFKPIKLHLL